MAARLEDDVASDKKRSGGVGDGKGGEALWHDGMERGELDFGEDASSRDGCCDRLFMAWVFPVIQKGFRSYLQPEDVPPLPSNFRTQRLLARAERHWAAQEDPSMWRTIWHLNRGYIVFGCICGGIQGILNAVGRPFILRALLLAAFSEHVSTSRIVVLVALFALVVSLEAFLGVIASHMLSDRLATRFSALASGLIVSKSTRRGRAPAGAPTEAALAGNDMMRTMINFRMLAGLATLTTGLLGGIIVLIVLLGGAAAAIGLTVMFTILFINRALSYETKAAEKANLGAADRRLRLMKQMIDGIHAVKLHGWERRYLAKIEGVRVEECRHIQRFRILQVMSIALGRASPVLASCAAFVAFVLLGNELQASDVFAALTIFQSLRLPLIMAPLMLTAYMNMVVSLGRIKAFLQTPDRNRQDEPESDEFVASVSSGDFSWSPPEKHEGAESGDEEAKTLKASNVARETGHPAAIELKSAKLSPPITAWYLRSVNLSIRRGTKVAVVGSVGSGKSSLLHALLGDMWASDRTRVRRSASCGWVPQSAFVLSTTLKNNVTMGRTFDSKRFKWAIHASAMETDLELLPDAERTEVGERGTTLSGGQQHRLGIARALYGQPDILILDDPLAAVDARVCESIFERAVERYVDEDKRRAVVMAVNQLHLIRRFDWVIVMVNGALVEQGVPADLERKQGSNLSRLLKDAVDNSATDRSEEPSRDQKETKKGGHRRKSSAPVENAKSDSDKKNNGLQVTQDGSNEESQDAERTDRKLVQAEKRETGTVATDIILTYLRSMRFWFVGLCGLVLSLAYSAFIFNDIWLAIWASQQGLSTRQNLFYVSVYVGSSVGHVALIMLMSSLMAIGGVRASRVLYNACIQRVVRAPASWFEATPSGRIVSRFSSDLAVVDVELGLTMDNFLQIGAIIVVLLGVMCFAVPPLTAVVALGVAMYSVQVYAVDRSNRESRRMVNASVSPMLTNFAEARGGRLVGQAMGLTQYFLTRHCRFTDRFAARTLLSFSLVSWGRHMSNVVSFFISMAAALFVLLQRDAYSKTEISLVMTYAFLVPYFLMIQSLNVSHLNMNLTSLERVLEYMGEGVPQEADWRRPGDPKPGTWPSAGALTFEGVSMRYRPGLPLAVQSATFAVGSGQKWGVVGRTGAGKSSLVALLFRIVERSAGSIRIDGKDALDLGLQTVREALTIIPQRPLLLEGTLRLNLDPFNEHAPERLEAVVRDVGLKPSMLDSEVGTGGSRLSAGERQLVSFARAMLRGAKIVCLDEPTANIDIATDNKIQALARTRFSGATVITIAHRLSTIIDCDRVLVMKRGRVGECGPPNQLLADRNGLFSGMVDALGSETAAELRAAAQAAATRRARAESKVAAEDNGVGDDRGDKELDIAIDSL